jgi:addiction module RelE/StbE family toxin
MDLTYQINYLPSAQQDLLEIIEYISKDDAQAAHAFVDKLDATISKLAAFPFLGLIPNDRRLQSLKYRMLVIQNYLVFYVVIEDEIEIRRILHGKRKYQFIL